MLGTVREWDDELGWGVIAGDDTPEDVWVHFTALVDQESLAPGSRVSFEVEGPVDEAGFRFRAASVHRY